MRVCDVEMAEPRAFATYHLMQRLRADHPTTTFAFVVGVACVFVFRVAVAVAFVLAFAVDVAFGVVVAFEFAFAFVIGCCC